jgi:hypothetical protein
VVSGAALLVLNRQKETVPLGSANHAWTPIPPES